jgi:DNA-binding HxlR family transcriptional regulator
MPTYGQYCAVARALDVLGDRWTLLIVRDLLSGPGRFNQIERSLPGISRSLLSQRLQMLERGGVVARHLEPDGRTRHYVLTPAGEDLRALVGTLREWGGRWELDDPRPEELDPAWLISSMIRRRRAGAVDRRVVVEFRLRGSRRTRVWMLLELHGEDDVCLKHPGFPPDLVVSAEAPALFKVWLGRLPRAEAERQGLLRIEGPPSLKRAFPGWFEWPSVPPLAERAEPAEPRRAARA